jgi:transposase
MQSLPETIEALRALVLATFAERDAAVTERDTLLTQNDRLRHLLLKLTRMHFGARSERLPEEQLQLGLEALEQAIAKDEAQAEKQDPELRKENATKRRASRGALPAHLPRVEVTLTPEDTACPCCRATMTMIGEDTSERLDVIPAQFRVIVTRRPKLACRTCPGTVVQAPAPTRLIEGGIPTEAMVAHVLVARYADHLPLYRQAQILARQGVILERSTLSFWMGYAAAEVAPVVARLREMMLASTRIFADETVVPVLDPGRGKTKQGYFWAIARDDRPWAGDQPPAVVYSYAPGRGHIHATALLGGYRGILQCDGYSAYKKFGGSKSADPAVTLAFCWSHYPEPIFMWSIWIAAQLHEALRTAVAQDNAWGRGGFRRRLGDGSADPVSNDVGCRDLRPPEGVARCAPSTLPPSSRRRLLISPPRRLRTDKPSRHPRGALVLPRGTPHLQSPPGFSLRQVAGAAQFD